jgi:quercetin dioxygenase-like cupin family protein
MRISSSSALLVGIAMSISMPALQGQEGKALSQKTGVVSAELFAGLVPDEGDKEITVLDVRYAPGGMNPRHFHPAAVTFYILSGTPVFQEEGKAPVTLKPGESLFAPAGTTHAHWNPSNSEGARWLEFIVAKKGQGRAIRKP